MMKNNAHKIKHLPWLLSAAMISACGGADVGSNTPTVPMKTVSGYVLDGNVGNSRVCLDINRDKQCTSVDTFVTTGSDGHYTLSYDATINIKEYALIADIRSNEATDVDYLIGTPNSDYVLAAFDPTATEVNISPVSTYMNTLQRATGKTSAEVTTEVSTVIDNAETFPYNGTQPLNTSDYLTSNFIQNKSNADTGVANLNTRLHNINEVLARGYQQSQAQWEDAIYNGSVTLTTPDWSAYSELAIESSQYNVGTQFASIVQGIGSKPYNTFNAKLEASALMFGTPTITQVTDAIGYQQNVKSAQSELVGTIVKYSITSNGTTTTTYFHFSSANTITVYIDFGGTLGCSTSTSPFTTMGANMSPTAFRDLLNQSLQSVQTPGTTISQASIASSVPSGCSSFSTMIASFESTMKPKPAVTSTGIPSCGNLPCNRAGLQASVGTNTVQKNPPAPIVSSPPPTVAGSINTCSNVGVNSQCAQARNKR